MKYLFFLLVCALPAIGSAQATKQIVSAVETDGSYSLTVRLDKSRKDDLVAAYLAAVKIGTGEPSDVTSITGTSEMETAAGTLVSLNTRRSALKIRSAKGDAASRAEAEKLGNLIRTHLGIDAPEPPAPPALPSID